MNNGKLKKVWLIVVLVFFLIIAIVASLYVIFNIGGTFGNIEGTEYNQEEGYGGKELPDNAR